MSRTHLVWCLSVAAAALLAFPAAAQECATGSGTCPGQIELPDGVPDCTNPWDCDEFPIELCSVEISPEGFSCFCGHLAEGGGACWFDNFCDAATPCPNGTSDCAAGEVCVENSCCGAPVCFDQCTDDCGCGPLDVQLQGFEVGSRDGAEPGRCRIPGEFRAPAGR